MRLVVLRLRPVNDLFGSIPLIHMQACDLVDALTGLHDELDGTRI